MTSRSLTILVTGVGGDLGQALVKALRLMPESPRIVGCDVEAGTIGAAFVDEYEVVPPASADGYLDALDGICQDTGVQVVVPGSEPEIEELSKEGDPLQLPAGIPVACQAQKWRKRYGDKLKCMEALNGAVELAPFADGTDFAAVDRMLKRSGFPVIVKGRKGSGSSSVHIAENRKELDECLKRTDCPLVQAHIDDEEGEYSVGVYGGDYEKRYIAFRRVIQPPLGCSWYAETSENEAVFDYAREVARASGVRGSVNIQVRHSSEGVRLLEINPRFSSLVAARAAAGFRDAEWTVNTVLGRPVDPLPSTYRSIRFQRFAHEMVDTGSGYRAVEAWQPKVEAAQRSQKT